MTSGSPYALSQALWPTPGYSVYLMFGLPAALIASTISRERWTGTAGSASPWKTQIGSDFSDDAIAAGSPPPQIGMTAAKWSGCAAAISQEPKPPIERSE